MNELVVRATELASRRWCVFPVEPGGKRPAVDRWEQRATASPEHVSSAWSGRWSGYNIGVACGPSRLVVVDLDRHGELPADWRALPGVVDGLDVFAQLLEWAGEARLPETYWTVTPSGGWHLYFTTPEDGPPIRNSAGLLGPAVDVRGAGGYVVAAGSVDGRAYEVLDDRSSAPLPAWIAGRLAPRTQRPAGRPGIAVPRGPVETQLRGLVEHVRSGPPGDRNGRLFWAACRIGELVASGQADQDAGELLVAAALDAGLRGGEREACRTVASGLRAGGGR
jgi:Bifunctional DNA primase/polymerase, N-terminal